MQADDTTNETERFVQSPPERPVGRAIRRGILNRCPACGSGRLFARFLKPVDHCAACGEALHHQRADDLPPYIVITIVGHLVLGGYMMTDLAFPLSTFAHLAIWAPITLFASLALLQPVKGGVVGLQWALRMHGFKDEAEEETGEPVLPRRKPAAEPSA